LGDDGVEGVGNFLEIAFEDEAGALAEGALQEGAVEAFEKDVKAHIFAVEGDAGVGGAGCGDAGVAEEGSADVFAEVGGVLDGVIEVEFPEAVEVLGLAEAGEVEGEGGAVFDGAEASPHAFEVDGDVGEDLVGFAGLGFGDLAADVGARVFLEGFDLLWCDVDAQVGDGAIGEEEVDALRGWESLVVAAGVGSWVSSRATARAATRIIRGRIIAPSFAKRGRTVCDCGGGGQMDAESALVGAGWSRGWG
jgi:hypothetical protein